MSQMGHQRRFGRALATSAVTQLQTYRCVALIDPLGQFWTRALKQRARANFQCCITATARLLPRPIIQLCSEGHFVKKPPNCLGFKQLRSCLRKDHPKRLATCNGCEYRIVSFENTLDMDSAQHFFGATQGGLHRNAFLPNTKEVGKSISVSWTYLGPRIRRSLRP